MTLTQVEKERYNRHIITTGFGEEGQLKLKAAKVLVIGAGGLGCPVIQYLVAAGVGQIGIVDGDTVSLSNLQRQILYTEGEIGHPKAAIAAAKMNGLNALADILVFDKFLTEKFADQLFPRYDLVVGCTDNYDSRYLIDRKSREHNIPFVHGAIREFEGQLCVLNYNGSPTYSDLFGAQPAELARPGGVVGAIPGIIGSLMAMEAIKIITGLGKVHSDKLLLFNALDNSFNQLCLST
ncbi:MAG TPA: HesA/MoeB/ThiF family protein [Paludibacter sp.]|nr:HesA/MoeB/ThiF family protein [Paludibacter sp.]